MDVKTEVVFFDAAGTLIEVRGSVGEIYRRLARRHGVEVSSARIQAGFMRAFRSQPPMAFPVETPADRLGALEYDWWRTVAREVFAEVAFPAFEAFFAEVFEFFRTTEAWYVFDDVIPTLTSLRERGVRMAVISNFDSRLDDLLRAFGLDSYFDAVHLSTRLGAEKPDPAIFRAALRHHGIEPAQALHIGDRVEADIAGAEACGIRALLIDRKNGATSPMRLGRLEEALLYLNA
ncbi:MAG: HAD-IA family hydrolase [Blastocatellia bacterium]|nr:HAD-IA family hydrolase [Blastocatellia bacterium]